MVILRVVREAVDFFLAKYRCPFPINLGEPVCDITALLVMPFGPGTGGLACWSGIGFSRTGDLAARFGVSLGFGLSFPNFLASRNSLTKFRTASHIEIGRQWDLQKSLLHRSTPVSQSISGLCLVSHSIGRYPLIPFSSWPISQLISSGSWW
jgi:hypothetical protein